MKELYQALAIVYLASDGNAVAAKLKKFGAVEVRVSIPPLAIEPTPAQEPIHATAQLQSPLQSALAPQALAVQTSDIQNVLEITTREFAKRVHEFEFFTKPYAVIHPGSGGLKKCWPAERYAELARRISEAQVLPVAVFGPADDVIRAQFESAIPANLHVARVENEKLRNVLALLAGARGYAGNDSGLSHLAARICQTTAIFGPTDPKVWAPLGDDVRVLRADDGNLDSISVEQVLESVLR